MEMTSMKQNDLVQSVERALDILDCLSSKKMNLVDISKLVDLNKSTVHRLLQTLISKGFVVQDDLSAQYGLTTKLVELGQRVIDDLNIVELAKPTLTKLSQLTQEVVHLVMIDQEGAVYIDKLESSNTIRMYSYVGKRIPLYCSAVGKAYLAFSKPITVKTKWEGIVSHLTRHTEHTICSEQGLLDDLHVTRSRGYAIDNEENELGIVCVAAPIYSHTKDIHYAVSVSTPKFRMDATTLETYGKAVVDATNEISALLGYKLDLGVKSI